MSKSNPWKYAQVDPARVKDNRFLNPRTPRTPPPPLTPPPGLNPKIEGDYILMPQTGTYALGVHALQEVCKAENNTAHPQFTRDNGSRIYRPLTFRETVEAKVNDYEKHNKNDNERKRLWNKWIDGCSGIINLAKSTKFKFVKKCVPLITIDKDFNEAFLATPYSSLQGIELNSGKRGVVYNDGVPYNKVEDHSAWRTALEDDVHLLRALRDITWHEKGQPDTLMGFYVRQNTDKDQLRSLCVFDLDYGSDADGGSSLDNYGSFLRVAQSKTP